MRFSRQGEWRRSRLNQKDEFTLESVQTQLEDTQSGLFLLANAGEVMDQMKSNLGTIDKICLDAKAVITNYPKIKKVR